MLPREDRAQKNHDNGKWLVCTRNRYICYLRSRGVKVTTEANQSKTCLLLQSRLRFHLHSGFVLSSKYSRMLPDNTSPCHLSHIIISRKVPSRGLRAPEHVQSHLVGEPSCSAVLPVLRAVDLRSREGARGQQVLASLPNMLVMGAVTHSYTQ